MNSSPKRPSEIFTFTTPTILAFPNLFEARAYKPGDKPRYDARFLMKEDHPDFMPLNQALAKMKGECFPTIEPRDLHLCLQRGDMIADEAKREGKDSEAYRGWIVLTTRTQFLDKQSLTVMLNGKLTDVPSDDSAAFEKYFYGGVECYPMIELVPYDGTRTQKGGISARPKSVLSMNRGEHVPALNGGGRTRGSNVWQHVTGHVSSIDPTAGVAGLI